MGLAGFCVKCRLWFAAQKMFARSLVVFVLKLYFTGGRLFNVNPVSNLFWNVPGWEFSSNIASNTIVDVIKC